MVRSVVEGLAGRWSPDLVAVVAIRSPELSPAVGPATR